MKRIAIKSSDLSSIGYDSELKILEVEFSGKTGPGRIYQYANIPENIYLELMRAPSIGSYFNTQIRDKYPSSKIG